METIYHYFRKKRPNFSGSVLISRKGEIVFQDAFGYADRSNMIPNTLQSQYPIASLTQIFVAVAIFQLIEKNFLQLSDPLEQYFTDSSFHGVTLQHLLNHTSGIYNYTKAGRKDLPWDHEYKPEEIWRFVRGQKHLFPAGSKLSYSNTNYLLLALIIQMVSGQGYREYVREHILTPCGMKQSGFLGEKFSNLALGYINGQPGKDWSATTGYGCGDLVSTVEDLYQFLRAYKGYQLLSRDVKNKMETVSFRGKFAGFSKLVASGWFYSFSHGMCLGHSGGIPSGYTSRMDLNLHHDTEIIILSNHQVSYGWYPIGANGASYVSKELSEILFERKLKFYEKII